MKKDTIKINSSWRDFSVKNNTLKNKDVGISSRKDSQSMNNDISKPIKLNDSSEVKRIKGAATPPSASKFQHNQKLIVEKFKKQSTKNMSKVQNIMYMENYNYSDLEILTEELSEQDEIKLGKFHQAIDMARELNPNPSKGGKFKLDLAGDRRLSGDFARIISKIAEDNSGTIVDGNDFWDMNKLISRVVDNRSIINCKSSRELESIIIILDSSPSCKSYARLYSELASISATYNDIEMYNAPNARITHRYDTRKKDFVKFMNLDDLKNDAPSWSYFKNRVIMFFGDDDGTKIVLNNTFKNKVYWFHTQKESTIKYSLDRYKYNNANLKIFPYVINKQNFIKAMKMIK